jgi:hypothetical protein
MRKTIAATIATSALLLLAGCGHGGMLNHSRPDEFAVQRQAPLIVPPDFALTPPQPGTPRPSTSTQQDTLDAMFGGTAPRSPVEKAAISRAGSADPGIRSSVGDPATHSVAKGAVTRDILAAPQGDGREAQAQVSG